MYFESFQLTAGNSFVKPQALSADFCSKKKEKFTIVAKYPIKSRGTSAVEHVEVIVARGAVLARITQAFIGF